MRTAPVAALLALLGAALTVPTAAAVGETCRGQVATIVGDPGGTVSGTDGDDVIVTNGARSIDAGAGNDTICVTATPDLRIVTLDAGEGGDVVDTTATGARTRSDLGSGADELYGGPGPDRVTAGTNGGVDGDHDLVATGDGKDDVVSGQAALVDTDDVDLGPGPGSLLVASETATGELRAEPGSPASITLSPSTRGHWVVDDRVDRATLDGETKVAWANLRVFRVNGLPRTHLHYIGTGRRDRVQLEGDVAGVDLGAGADEVLLETADGISRTFMGGRGRDLMEIHGSQFFADLRRGRLSAHLGRTDARITGFEDLWVSAARARLQGDAGPNRLTALSCTAEVRGGRGDDTLDSLGLSYGCAPPHGPLGIWQYGGPGDDVLLGSSLPDHLYGGPGRDRADGRARQDLCRAEARTNCES